MTEVDARAADTLLSRIEIAAGEIVPKNAPNAVLIKQIIESINGLRSILGVVRAH